MTDKLMMPGGTFTLRLETPQKSTGEKKELDSTSFWAMRAGKHVAHRNACARDAAIATSKLRLRIWTSRQTYIERIACLSNLVQKGTEQ